MDPNFDPTFRNPFPPYVEPTHRDWEQYKRICWQDKAARERWGAGRPTIQQKGEDDEKNC